MQGEILRPAIQRDQAALRALGMSGTPGFFINGRWISGAQQIGTFVAVIDDELKHRAHRRKARRQGDYQTWVVEEGLKTLGGKTAERQWRDGRARHAPRHDARLASRSEPAQPRPGDHGFLGRLVGSRVLPRREIRRLRICRWCRFLFLPVLIGSPRFLPGLARDPPGDAGDQRRSAPCQSTRSRRPTQDTTACR
ncbi:MAG: thioredoxin domain-containing protein [Myxococcales bacterium]|nr:thioredoxin domain-containing protein [Myxococcales bacterium]